MLQIRLFFAQRPVIHQMQDKPHPQHSIPPNQSNTTHHQAVEPAPTSSFNFDCASLIVPSHTFARHGKCCVSSTLTTSDSVVLCCARGDSTVLHGLDTASSGTTEWRGCQTRAVCERGRRDATSNDSVGMARDEGECANELSWRFGCAGRGMAGWSGGAATTVWLLRGGSL